jgi:hypothetical protein
MILRLFNDKYTNLQDFSIGCSGNYLMAALLTYFTNIFEYLHVVATIFSALLAKNLFLFFKN